MSMEAFPPVSTAPSEAPQAAPEMVDLGVASQVEYWTKELDCTELDLQEAIRITGTNAVKVRAFFLA